MTATSFGEFNFGHGTANKYAAGCRCAPCRAAGAKGARKRYVRNVAKGLHALDPRHGEEHGYQAGCRCERCTAAHAAASKAAYARRKAGAA